jgi:hypothetical protein
VTQLTDHPDELSALDEFPAWQGSDKVSFSSNYGGADQVYALSATSNKGSGGLVVVKAIEAWFGPN